MLLLRRGDGRAVARGGDGERPGGARRVGVGKIPGGRTAPRRCGGAGHEAAGALDQAVARGPQAGVPPRGGVGLRATKGPALWPRRLTAAAVRSVRAAGSEPMWAA